MQQGVMGLISKKRDNQVQNTNYANLEHKWQKKKGKKILFPECNNEFFSMFTESFYGHICVISAVNYIII